MKSRSIILSLVFLFCVASFLSAADELILWNKFGSDTEIQNSEVGPDLTFYTGGTWPNVQGAISYVPGVFGDCATTTGSYSMYDRVHRIVLANYGNYINTEKGTIECWFKQVVDPLDYTHNHYRIFDGSFGLAKGDIAFCSSDFTTVPEFGNVPKLYFSLRFGEPTGINIRSIADGTYGVDISSYNNTWIHVAAVWDRNGIDGTGNTMRIYVNGSIAGISTNNGWGTTFTGSDVDICGGSDILSEKFYIDNLKMYNYAKTDFSDRFTEGTNTGPNITPSITIVEPDGANDDADASFTITWTDSDPDDNAQISLYYNTAPTNISGTLITSGINEDADGANGSYVWDTSAMPEGSYYIYAKIDDGNNPPVYGFSLSRTVTISHATPTPIPPEAPANLHATAGRDVVNLNWKKSTNVTIAYYKIYRNLTSDFDISDNNYIGQTDGPDKITYHDRNVEEDTIYYYKVTAVSADGIESKPSDEAWARPGTKQHNLLLQNNKINPKKGEKVRVKFTVEKASRVKIKIFNMKGTLVYEYPELQLPAGEYEKQWAGINDNLDVVSSGVYAVQLFIDDELVDTKKVIIVK